MSVAGRCCYSEMLLTNCVSTSMEVEELWSEVFRWDLTQVRTSALVGLRSNRASAWERSRGHFSTVKNIIYKQKTFKRTANLPTSGCPDNFSPSSDSGMLQLQLAARQWRGTLQSVMGPSSLDQTGSSTGQRSKAQQTTNWTTAAT